MRAIVFDSGPIISLTLNNLLWVLKPLKAKFKGDFCITEAVRKELIDHPMETKKFKFEAMQVLKCIKEGTITVIGSDKISDRASELMELSNNIYTLKGQNLRLFHYAEMSVLAACKEIGAQAAIVDERITRILIENPSRIEELLKKRMHITPEVDRNALKDFRNQFQDLKFLRSTEIAAMAYEQGLLNDYIASKGTLQNPEEELVEAMLWGLKLNGCAISEREIRQAVKIESRR